MLSARSATWPETAWSGFVDWFGTVSFAEWLAAAAFLVSAAALCVSVWVDRAAARVELRTKKLIGQHQGRAAREIALYEVTVTNTGRRPTEITAIQLVLGRRFYWRMAGRKQRSFIMTTTDELSLVSSALPMMLDVGGTATMYFDRAVVDPQLDKESATRIHARAATSTAGYPGSKTLTVTRDA